MSPQPRWSSFLACAINIFLFSSTNPFNYANSSNSETCNDSDCLLLYSALCSHSRDIAPPGWVRYYYNQSEGFGKPLTLSIYIQIVYFITSQQWWHNFHKISRLCSTRLRPIAVHTVYLFYKYTKIWRTENEKISSTNPLYYAYCSKYEPNFATIYLAAFCSHSRAIGSAWLSVLLM